MLTQEIGLVAVALVIVWGVSELTAQLRRRLDRRKATGRQLARLLDVRHRLLCYRKITEESSNFSPRSAEDQASLRAMLKGVLPEFDEVRRAFEESTAIIAEIDPFFAFRLRMTQWQVPAVARFGGIATADRAVYARWTPIEKPFIQHLQDGIDEMILTLARRHGSGSWADVQEYMRQPLELPEGIKQVFKDLKERLPADSREQVA